jgi:hypothetical protein
MKPKKGDGILTCPECGAALKFSTSTRSDGTVYRDTWCENDSFNGKRVELDPKTYLPKD